VSANQDQRTNQIIITLASAAVLVLALWLRLQFIHAIRLYPDEFVTLLAVQMIGEKGLPVMPSGLFYEHGQLFSYFGSLASLIGPGQIMVRYVSLVCGLLTLGLAFYIGRRWFSPAVGLIAITGLAVAPAAIHWSGRARMYALLQLLVLLTLGLAYEGIVRNKARWRWAALLVYLGATLTQFAAVALAPPLALAAFAIWLLGQPPARRSWHSLKSTLLKRHIWFELVALIGILVVAFWVKRLGQPKGLEAFRVEDTLAGLVQVFTIYSDFSFNLASGWQAVAPFYLALPSLIFGPFALLAIGGEWLEHRRGGRASSLDAPQATAGYPALYLTLILLITTLEIILLVSPDRRDDKYIFMLLPVLFLLGAQGMMVGLRLVLSIVRPKPSSSLYSLVTLIGPLLISGLILVVARPSVASLLSQPGEDYDAAFAFVRNHWQPGDKIMTGTPPAAAFYLGHNDYYSVQRRGGYDYRILTVAGQAVDRWLGSPAIRTEQALHQVLANNNVWLVLERWGLQR